MKFLIDFFFDRPTTMDIKKIQSYQMSTENCIPKLSFQRLVREILLTLKSGFRFQAEALGALQVWFKKNIDEFIYSILKFCQNFYRLQLKPILLDCFKILILLQFIVKELLFVQKILHLLEEFAGK